MKKLVYIALFTSFIYVLGFIPLIPIPGIGVPLILQNFGVLLAGSVLGTIGTISVLLFLVLAAVGLPVLAGGRGGIAVFFGPTAGFLYGYVLAAFIIGLLTIRSWLYLNFFRMFIINLIGVFIIYCVGIPIFMIVTKIELSKAIITNSIFLLPDIAKALLSAYTAMQFKKHYPLITRDKYISYHS